MSETDPTRNARATVQRIAHGGGWITWQPEDGSRYAVKLDIINEGADRGDAVLLVRIHRRTWSFQFPLNAYRRKESPGWSVKRIREEGIPMDIGQAAKPLIHAAIDLLGRP